MSSMETRVRKVVNAFEERGWKFAGIWRKYAGQLMCGRVLVPELKE